MKLNLEEVYKEIEAFKDYGIDASLLYNAKKENLWLTINASSTPKIKVYAWAVWVEEHWWISEGGIFVSNILKKYPSCRPILESKMPQTFNLTEENQIIVELPDKVEVVASLFFFLNSLGELQTLINNFYKDYIE